VALAAPIVRDWPNAGEKLAAMSRMRTIPCLTLIAGYARRDGLEFDVWHPIEATMIHAIVHESAKRSTLRGTVLVIHARATFSADHLDDPDDEWRTELLWEASELLGPWVERPLWQQTHRWRCARLRAGDSVGGPLSFESPRGGSLAVCGEGFALDGGLEGAYFSGLALGEQIGTLPRVRKHLASA
jgi:predicted NAD/FAD-dependent oxidoreductase